MIPGRFPLHLLLAVLIVPVLVSCEPYMSMTDRIPAQTQQAASLLPETPRYVGKVEIGTVLRQIGDLRGVNLVDSLRNHAPPAVRQFLQTTGIDPASDLEAAYASLEEQDTVSAVLFGNVTPEQMDRYLDESPDGMGHATTYRDVPVYHLALEGPTPLGPSDTLSVAFVGNGTMAVGMGGDRINSMVDRHRAAQGGLRQNDSYMALVKRVARGSTAWLVGGDVVGAALGDSAGTEVEKASDSTDDNPRVNRAGLERALAEWSDRVLGLSEVSSLDGRAGDKMSRLKSRLREQAVSLTLTDDALDGTVYLTMRDEESASSVVKVAEGAVAVMKLSREDMDERHRDLIDEIEIEQDGSIVHIQFSLDREKIRKSTSGSQPIARTSLVDSAADVALESVAIPSKGVALSRETSRFAIQILLSALKQDCANGC